MWLLISQSGLHQDYFQKFHVASSVKLPFQVTLFDWSCYIWLDNRLRERLNFRNMSQTRKQYDREFKVMAVELSKSRSDLSVLSKELEIRPALLYRWRKELETKVETSFPGKGKVIYTPEQAEIHRLKKELLDMQQERDILKKAVGIFSRSDGKYSGS
jgi:transposase